MSKMAKLNSQSRINRAWTKPFVQITTTESGWTTEEKWTKCYPMTGREMNRALYQNGLWWTLAGYGRGWVKPYETPKLDLNKKYVIAERFGFIQIKEVK